MREGAPCSQSWEAIISAGCSCTFQCDCFRGTHAPAQDLSPTALQPNRLIGFPGVKFGGSEHCFVIGTLGGGTGRWCLTFPQGRNFSNKCIHTFELYVLLPSPPNAIFLLSGIRYRAPY